MTFPTIPNDITTEWLTAELGATVLGGGQVTGLSLDNIGEGTGIFGEIVRLNLTVEGGTGAPTSMVAKMPCTEPANLAIAMALGLYERELRMFDDVIDQSPINAPQRYLSAENDQGGFILLLEDLSDRYDVGDQVVGATLEQAERVVDVLAAFHAHWWGSPKLDDFTWLPRPDAPQYQAAVPPIYRAGLPVLQAEWADRVPAAAMDLAVELEPRFEELLLRTATGPETLIHTDTRLDNIFFAKDDSGDVALIDFQLALRGRAVADLAYMIGNSVPHEIARDNWESLLRRWHEAITAAGVADYSFDDALQHYREAVLYYFSGPMSLVGTFDSGNDRGAAMVEAYTVRLLTHAIDIDAGVVLR